MGKENNFFWYKLTEKNSKNNILKTLEFTTKNEIKNEKLPNILEKLDPTFSKKVSLILKKEVYFTVNNNEESYYLISRGIINDDQANFLQKKHILTRKYENSINDLYQNINY